MSCSCKLQLKVVQLQLHIHRSTFLLTVRFIRVSLGQGNRNLSRVYREFELKVRVKLIVKEWKNEVKFKGNQI